MSSTFGSQTFVAFVLELYKVVCLFAFPRRVRASAP
jgi:hypothetical protein